MNENLLSVRELTEKDIEPITHYWLSAEPAFLHAMGADARKIPTQEQWQEMLREQISQSYEQKKSYCMIWEIDGKSIGHSNINKIIFAEEAYMHLHIWKKEKRMKSLGTSFVKLTIPWFFEKYHLKKLYCEPYALNPAPNKTLQKTGFEFVREYTTVPGWLNFEQPVKLWVMSYKKFKELALK
jgi:RimJ/RimL family protein N-acetyltransferase